MTIKKQFQQETQGNVLLKLAKNMAAYGGSCTRQTRLGPGSNGDEGRQEHHMTSQEHHLRGDTRDALHHEGV